MHDEINVQKDCSSSCVRWVKAETRRPDGRTQLVRMMAKCLDGQVRMMNSVSGADSFVATIL